MTDTDSPERKILRVAGGTGVGSLASGIARVVEEGMIPVLEFVGAGAGNQAIKGLATANSLLARQGRILHVIPCFVTRMVNKKERTAMQLIGKVYDL